MENIFTDVHPLEKAAQEKYGLSEDVMIENAAAALESACLTLLCSAGEYAHPEKSVLIVCGNGNNGADGYALARRIAGDIPVCIFFAAEPKTESCAKQKKAAQNTGIPFVSEAKLSECIEKTSVIVDCLYGTGFHGAFDGKTAKLVQMLNKAKSARLACDIPSGITSDGVIPTIINGDLLAFSADCTVTMGSYKTALFSDEAKDFCGEIVRADIGISRSLFESEKPYACLLGEEDMRLPVREKKSVHKGNFGHVAVVTGEKQGAAAVAGTAALTFGAGLVTLVKSFPDKKLSVKISPELMFDAEFPEKTTAVLLGSGLGRSFTEKSPVTLAVQRVRRLIEGQKRRAVVLDADIFYYPQIAEFLDQIFCPAVLTPHPKEFQSLLSLCGFGGYSIQEIAEQRIELAKKFTKRFPDTVLVLKGANTIISSASGIYISTEGRQCLAKAGSGDVLAGLVTALLAQGYSAHNAAVTGVLAHGIASQHAVNSYSLTPLKLIQLCAEL